MAELEFPTPDTYIWRPKIRRFTVGAHKSIDTSDWPNRTWNWSLDPDLGPVAILEGGPLRYTVLFEYLTWGGQYGRHWVVQSYDVNDGVPHATG